MDEWITNKTPKSQDIVIVSIKDDSGDAPYYYTSCGWCYKNVWIVDNEVCFGVIGWKPLPKPLIK